MLVEAFGTLDGRRVVAVEREYVGAFFDLHLRGSDRHVFDRVPARYPETTFVA